MNKTIECQIKLSSFEKFKATDYKIKIESKIVEEKLKESLFPLEEIFLRNIKSMGFSDKRISELTNLSVQKVSELRYKLKIFPSYKRVDTFAAEFFSETS